MKNFKAGDLALTLVAIAGHLDVGECVEVIRETQSGDKFKYPSGNLVQMTYAGVMVTKCGYKYIYQPHELLPLSGDPDVQVQKTVSRWLA